MGRKLLSAGLGALLVLVLFGGCALLRQDQCAAARTRVQSLRVETEAWAQARVDYRRWCDWPWSPEPWSSL
jgi:hypothetical protein